MEFFIIILLLLLNGFFAFSPTLLTKHCLSFMQCRAMCRAACFDLQVRLSVVSVVLTFSASLSARVPSTPIPFSALSDSVNVVFMFGGVLLFQHTSQIECRKCCVDL